jgi:fructose-1,6-bisphosphatase I
MDRNPHTLTRYILSEQQKHREASGDLSLILSAIATACKAISSAVRRAGLTGLYGADGGSNASGDSVKKLDVLSDEIFCNTLRHTKRVALMVSEEQEAPVVVEGAESAKYICSFDPLDGSSIIDCAGGVGSIFGITRRAAECVGQPATAAECLQPGTALIAAGYCLYGSSTQLVLTFQGGEVNAFTLDPSIGEFILSQPALRMPEPAQRIYSLNEGNLDSFPQFVKQYVAECKTGKPYSLRCAFCPPPSRPAARLCAYPHPT